MISMQFFRNNCIIVILTYNIGVQNTGAIRQNIFLGIINKSKGIKIIRQVSMKK
jgi:hypothetical protein